MEQQRLQRRKNYVDTGAMVGLLLLSASLITGASGGTTSAATEYRALDNTGNNLVNPALGTPNGKQVRYTPTFPDFTSANGFPLTRAGAPNPRQLSNAIAANNANINNNRHISDGFTIFGQFLDHDITSTPGGSEVANIPVPSCDPIFDLACTGSQVLPFTRSSRDSDGRITNSITPFIDLSQVYGHNNVLGRLLRTAIGGKLKLLPNEKLGDLLPIDGVDVALPNQDDMRNPFGDNRKLFAAGDSRANENPLLQVFQTIFAREHNRLAKDLATANAGWNDEKLYQEARRRNIAQFQHIAYNEYFPLLFGADLIPPYTYNQTANPQIDVAFSTAAFRYGHSEINSVIYRLGADMQPTPGGPILFRDAFFNTQPVLEEGVEPLMRGMQYAIQQAVDNFFRDDVRNFIWGGSGRVGADLFAWNVQRGRDHGICTLNACRSYFGLTPYTDFSQITSNATLVSVLRTQYGGNIDLVDLYAGGLCENRHRNGNLGPVFEAIIADQFTRIRNADRFYFETTDPNLRFTAEEVDAIKSTRLSHIFARNSNYQPAEAFFYKPLTLSDGEFSSGELAALSFDTHAVKPFPGFYIGWNISSDSKSISFRLAGKTRGWLAIGFGVDGAKFGMVNMDAVIGYVPTGGDAVVRDYYVKSRVVPTADASQDISGVSGGELASGLTWVTFSRAVETPDKDTDNPILSSIQSIYWAMGESDSLLHHGVYRGSLGLNLLDAKANLKPSSTGSALATTGTLQISSAYSISWDLQSDYLLINATVSCSGGCWVGFGISPGTGMTGADLAILTFDDSGVPSLQDAHSKGNTFPVFDDDRPDGTKNLKLIAARQSSDTTFLSFQRPLAAVDEAYDNPITLGSAGTHVIAAWGSSNTLAYHGPSHHAHSLVYFDNAALLGSCSAEEESSESAQIDATHGGLLAFAWWISASIGIIAQEYAGKIGGKTGRLIHKLAMGTTVICTMAGVFFMIAKEGPLTVANHHRLGFAILAICIVQATAGILIGFFPLQRKLRYFHRFVGYSTWLLAQVNIALGFVQVEAGIFFYAFYLIFSTGVIIAILISKFGRNEDGEIALFQKRDKITPN